MKENNISFLYEEADAGLQISESEIRKIYSRVEDEVSRRIFKNRLLFSLTDEHVYMKNVISSTEIGKRFLNDVEEKDNKNLYIYGAGTRGKRLIEMLPDKNWCGFIDSQCGGTYKGLPIISLDDFSYSPDTVIVVSNYKGYENIIKLLQEKYFGSDIIALGHYDNEFSKIIYFEERCIGKDEIEGVFIDAGCYNGADTLRYMSRQHLKENLKVFAFEPDKRNYNVCKETLKDYENIKLYNSGLSNSKRIDLFFEGGEGARVSENGTNKVQLYALDSLIKDEKVGFIKVDVEGEEEKLLRGASNVIQRQCPTVAISVYHKRSDIWRIPQLLLKLNSKYTFRLGHYTVSYGDTVLYAIDSVNEK